MLRTWLDSRPTAWPESLPSGWATPPAAEVAAVCRAVGDLLPLTRSDTRTDPPLDKAIMDSLFACGLFSLTVPRACGGLDASLRDFTLAMQQVGRLGPAYAMTAVPHLCISVHSVARLCAPADSAPILAAIRDERRLLAFAITEDQGSDLSAMRTRLTRGDDGRLRLNGRKQWITNLSRASHVVVAALCPDLHRAPGAAVLVLVPLSQPGVRVSQPWEKIAANGSDTADLFLDDVVVPEQALLGAPGQALALFGGMVQPGRLGAAAAAVGMAAEALQQARSDRLQTLTGRDLHAMDLAIQTLGACLRLTASYGDEGHPEFSLLVSLAKHLCTREAQALVAALDLGYARAGRQAPPAVRRASDTIGLFRLLKGPGDVIALQAVSAWLPALGQAAAPLLHDARPLALALDWLLQGYAWLSREGGPSLQPVAAASLADASAAWWLLFAAFHADRDGARSDPPCPGARRWAWRRFAAAARHARAARAVASTDAVERLYAVVLPLAAMGGALEFPAEGSACA